MEIFSKCAPAVPDLTNGHGKGRNSFVPTTPGHVQSLFKSRLTEICTRFDDWTLPFKLVGRLGHVAPESWRRYEPWPLVDEVGGEEIGLEITSSLIKQSGAQAGDKVEAFGFMRARLIRGQVVLRFEVLAFSLYEEPPSPKAEEEDLTLLSILRRYPPTRRVFPGQSDMRLLILGLGSTPDQEEAMQNSLGGVWHSRSVSVVSLDGRDKVGLRQILLKNQANIVVFLAGEAGCSALEDPEMLLPLATCPAYRILVRERALEADPADGKGAVAACLVDCCFSSLIEAGRYIRQETGRLWREREEERARQEELAALRESLARMADISAHPVKPGMMRMIMPGLILGGILGMFGVIMARLFIGH